MKLVKFEQVIQSLLVEDKVYLSHKCKSLLSPGENYGSVILDVEVKLRKGNATNIEETVHCIAKVCPPHGFLWHLFNIPVTFKKEIGMYTTIVPQLVDFCGKHGLPLNCYAKCYGARISSDEYAEEVDENACLLLENLKHIGYNTLNRFVGFDYNNTKTIIKDLAVFHAVPIAFKLKFPEIFQTFAPVLQRGTNVIITEEDVKPMYNTFEEYIDESYNHILPRVLEGYRKIMNYAKSDEGTCNLFSTITHNDMWVNNIMTRPENDNDLRHKFVDFQLTLHSSLANDLIFFLYSSVQIETLRIYYDDFINLYYDTFISTLKKFSCNVNDYTFHAFLTELSYVAKNFQFCHVLFMLTPIYTLKEKAKDLSEFSIDDFKPCKENLHENFKQRLCFVIEDFAMRNWI